LDLYEAKMETTPPVLDGLGRIVQEAIDHWEPRQGLALALEYLAPRFTDASMVSHKNIYKKYEVRKHSGNFPSNCGILIYLVRKLLQTVSFDGKNGETNLIFV
jgi:hypothetical protein